MKAKLPLCLSALFFAQIALSAPTVFQPLSEKNTGIHFTLPYSLGTHDGDVHVLKGGMTLDLASLSSSAGELHVPINSITTGNEERDCHLQESLGLDYQQSDYPKEHVCTKNQLPASGKNAVSFPEIILKITSLKKQENNGFTEATGSWTIHGVTVPTRLSVKLTFEGSKLRIQGSQPFSLKAFGIQVKSAHVLFATISVEDQAKLDFNILLESKP